MSDFDPDLDAPLDDPPRDARKRAFAWTFGVCAGLPLVAGAAAIVFPGSNYEGILYLLAMPVVWVVALGTGLVVVLARRPEPGWGIVLGSLAGAIVGFALCSGVFTLGGAF